MIETIFDLHSDISAMRNLVLYYETRILRKQIAIEEILHGQALRQDGETISTPPPDNSPSVPEMLRSVLPEITREPFEYRDLTAKAIAKFPEHIVKIRRGVHLSCQTLIKQGTLTKVPGGMAKGKLILG